MANVRVALEKAAFLEFRLVHKDNQELLQQGIIPPGYEVLKEQRVLQNGEKQVMPYVVSKTPIPGLNGKNVTRAGVGNTWATAVNINGSTLEIAITGAAAQTIRWTWNFTCTVGGAT